MYFFGEKDGNSAKQKYIDLYIDFKTCKTLDRRYVPLYVRKYNIFSWEELAREVSIWWRSGSQEVAKR